MISLQNFIRYLKELTESLTELMNEIIKSKEIPCKLQEVYITLLLEDASDLKEPKKFCQGNGRKIESVFKILY